METVTLQTLLKSEEINHWRICASSVFATCCDCVRSVSAEILEEAVECNLDGRGPEAMYWLCPWQPGGDGHSEQDP
jgi:hypothetical protein